LGGGLANVRGGVKMPETLIDSKNNKKNTLTNSGGGAGIYPPPPRGECINITAF